MKIPGKNISPKTLAKGIFVIVLLWVISGIILPPKRAEISKDGTASTLPAVEVAHFQAERKTTSITLYGNTQASRRVDMKAEVQGKVTAIAAQEGAAVKEGDPLLTIEPRDLQARLSEAEALIKQRQIEYDAALKLGTKGFSSETRLAEADAALQQAKAQAIRARIDMGNTAMKAPFDGWLERINVEVGDLIGPGILVGQGTFNDGTNIATFLDRDPMLAVAQVPEIYIGELKMGVVGKVKLVDGTEVEGRVSFIGGIADSVTRTFRVEMEIPNPDGAIRSGVTASLTVPVKEEMAHHLPSSLLVLGQTGEMGIRGVENKKVAFYPASITDSDTDGVWITGLPASVDIITRGQAFVLEGNEVTVKEAARQ